MKNSNTEKKHNKLKKTFAKTGLFVALFGVTAAGVYFGLPQDSLPAVVNEEDEEENYVPSTPTLSGSARLVNNLQEGIVGGLNLNVHTFKVEIPGKGEGMNTITNGTNGGIDLKLQIGNLSSTDMKIIHSINLDLDANLKYNPTTGYAHERNLKVTLVDDEAYIGLTNPIKDTAEAEQVWDLKYKTSIKEKEMLVWDETAQEFVSVYDEITGGKQIYEFGSLDEVIDTILTILNSNEDGNGMDITIPSLFDLINGSSEESSEEESDTESSGLDLDGMLDSLNHMVETNTDTGHYFTLNLELGSLDLSVGLGTDTSYNLTKIDLPANPTGAAEVDPLVITKGEGADTKTVAKIALSADVSNISSSNNNLIMAPADKESYRALEDSMDLWERIAKLAKSPSFALKTLHTEGDEDKKGLLLTHYKRTSFHGDTVAYVPQETATLDLNVNAKFGKKYSLEGLGLGLEFESKYQDEDLNDLVSRAALGVNYDRRFQTVNESKEFAASAGAFININDVLKAKTNKLTIDELYARIKNLISSSSEEESTTSESTIDTDKLLDTAKKVIEIVAKNFILVSDIKDAVKNIIDSPFIQDVKQMTFGSALDLIKTIQNDDNYLHIVLDLNYLGLPGEIELAIDARSDSKGLVGLNFRGVRFDLVQLDGSILINELGQSDKVFLTEEEIASYDSMNHILGIYDQVKEIVDDEAVSIGIEGSIMNKDEYEQETTGVKIEGEAAFTWAKNEGKGRAALSIDHIAENYAQKHNVAFDVVNEKTVDEESEIIDRNQYVAFKYDTNNGELHENPTDLEDSKLYREDGKVATNPVNQNGIAAKLDYSSFSSVFTEVKDVLTQQEFKDRVSFFGKFTWAILEPSLGNLLGGLGESEVQDDPYLFRLFENQLLLEASIGDEESSFRLNKQVFGTSSDIIVSLGYQTDKPAKAIDEENTNTYLNDNSEVENTYNGNGLAYIGVNIANASKESAKPLEVDLKINLNELDPNETFVSLDTEGMKEIKGVDRLMSYAANGLMMGENNSATPTTFDFGLNASVTLFQHEIDLINASLKTNIGSSSTKLHASMLLPAIKGLNAPDSDIYFRALEEEGNHDVHAYYDAHSVVTTMNGQNEEEILVPSNTEEGGELFLTRESDYGKVRDVRDTLTLTGAEFGEHPLEYLLQYMVGVDTRYFATEEEAEPAEPVAEPVEEQAEEKSGWNPFAKEALHLEDCELSYNFVDGEENLQENEIGESKWDLSVNLGKLLHMEYLLDTVHIGLSGLKGDTFSTISKLDIGANVKLGNSDQGHGIKLAAVNISLGLKNVDKINGYTDSWTEEDEKAGCGFVGYKNYTANSILNNDYNLYVGFGAYAL